jgi:hypothetical protein
MADAPPEADVPAEFTNFKYPLPHLAQAMQGKGPVRIVAMGSSSTAGRWDVVPYPHRLELYLRARYQDRFPDLRIDVLNRGKGGEEAIEELPRFDADILAERPSLVIWEPTQSSTRKTRSTIWTRSPRRSRRVWRSYATNQWTRC